MWLGKPQNKRERAAVRHRFWYDAPVFRYIQCNNGWLELRVERGKPYRVRRVQAPPINVDPIYHTTIALPRRDVLRAYRGNVIARAQHVAGLTHIRFRKLYGPRVSTQAGSRAGDGDSYYQGQKLRRIGRAFPPPQGACGDCTDLATACPGCARRLANEEASRWPIDVVRLAAASRDPREQVRLLYQAQLRYAAQQRRSKKSTPRGEPKGDHAAA